MLQSTYRKLVEEPGCINVGENIENFQQSSQLSSWYQKEKSEQGFIVKHYETSLQFLIPMYNLFTLQRTSAMKYPNRRSLKNRLDEQKNQTIVLDHQLSSSVSCQENLNLNLLVEKQTNWLQKVLTQLHNRVHNGRDKRRRQYQLTMSITEDRVFKSSSSSEREIQTRAAYCFCTK